jgi:hypothetical protein
MKGRERLLFVLDGTVASIQQVKGHVSKHEDGQAVALLNEVGVSLLAVAVGLQKLAGGD